MKTIKVKKLELNKGESEDLSIVSKKLDYSADKISIDILNWDSFEYKPSVKFVIAYNQNEIFLKYYIDEDSIRAVKTNDNDMVCEDSCVEFFLSPEDDGIYYNIEFNCIGTCLVGYGKSRGDRKLIDTAKVNRIKRFSSLGRMPFTEKAGNYKWELTAVISSEVFILHKIKKLEGSTFKANFFKCGDKLTRPHYLSWNRIKTEKPDFHRPEFFGALEFV